jgi:hypothetical protein
MMLHYTSQDDTGRLSFVIGASAIHEGCDEVLSDVAWWDDWSPPVSTVLVGHLDNPSVSMIPRASAWFATPQPPPPLRSYPIYVPAIRPAPEIPICSLPALSFTAAETPFFFKQSARFADAMKYAERSDEPPIDCETYRKRKRSVFLKDAESHVVSEEMPDAATCTAAFSDEKTPDDSMDLVVAETSKEPAAAATTSKKEICNLLIAAAQEALRELDADNGSLPEPLAKRSRQD